MSGEGKYGRLPQPKDRRKVNVRFGALELRPEPKHDKAAEYEEETGDPYAPFEKKKAAEPDESMLAKVGKFAGELGANVSKPWSSMMKKDEEE